MQFFSLEGLDGVALTPRDGTEATPSNGPPPPRQTNAVKVATFNIQVFGEAKLSSPRVVEILTKIVRQYDVIAIQEIRAKSQNVLPQFVEALNADGRHYDYVIGPRLGRSVSKEQYAFVYDTETIETDRSQLYTINDPEDLLHREPLVGWFRTRSASPEEAFTFSLVNIHTDPERAEEECDWMKDVFFKVRDDGRMEDDVILLGDFNLDARRMNKLSRIGSMNAAVIGLPTNTRGTQQYDNILFTADATKEFTGRSGVDNFLRQFNLSLAEALEVSDHLPVWAEFNVYEGGQPGRVASAGVQAQR